jgi:RHS repeat-associated protein
MPKYEYDSALRRLGQRTTLAGVGLGYRSFAYDANGSVEGLEGSDGEIATADRYRYDPYGELQDAETDLSAAAKENPFRFEGFYYDASVKTYDMQARPYRPDVGRFLTQDRFESGSGDLALQSDPMTSNRYTFAGANPVNNIEFDGHKSCTSTCRPGEHQQNYDGSVRRIRGHADPTLSELSSDSRRGGRVNTRSARLAAGMGNLQLAAHYLALAREERQSLLDYKARSADIEALIAKDTAPEGPGGRNTQRLPSTRRTRLIGSRLEFRGSHGREPELREARFCRRRIKSAGSLPSRTPAGTWSPLRAHALSLAGLKLRATGGLSSALGLSLRVGRVKRFVTTQASEGE